jgi:hypothetical protein
MDLQQNEFGIKLFALRNSFSLIVNSRVMLTSKFKITAERIIQDKITESYGKLKDVPWYLMEPTVWNNVWDVGKVGRMNGKTDEEISVEIYSLVINNYNSIVEWSRNNETVKMINNGIKQNDVVKIIYHLLTFDDIQTLEKMDSRLFFFYFFCVQELIGHHEKIEKLMKKLGKDKEWNKLFETFALDQITGILDDVIPVDLVKIIVGYSNLSIHNVDDFNCILNKIIRL